MDIEKYREEVRESALQWLSEIDQDQFVKEFLELESQNCLSPKVCDVFWINDNCKKEHNK